MKRNFSSIVLSCLVLGAWSCNDSGTTTSGSGDSATVQQDTIGNANNNTANLNATPLSQADSTFVMEAAVGGLTEVESGRVAQQNGMNEGVKSFGQMMITDHERANSELMSIVSSRGMTPPGTLPADKQKHIDDMKNMKGKAFDNHYVNMMVNDHQKTIDLFRKQSENGTDPQLKTFATNTLPVLQKHMDSAQALKKRMK